MSDARTLAVLALWLLLAACADRPLIGVTVTNSPDTLPCAPDGACRK